MPPIAGNVHCVLHRERALGLVGEPGRKPAAAGNIQHVPAFRSLLAGFHDIEVEDHQTGRASGETDVVDVVSPIPLNDGGVTGGALFPSHAPLLRAGPSAGTALDAVQSRHLAVRTQEKDRPPAFGGLHSSLAKRVRGGHRSFFQP
jgi:hypothetical protein